MKVAFVSQAIDSILPPFQNSVGGCTYGSCRAFPRDCEILVCGSQVANAGPPIVDDGNIRFQFFRTTTKDRLAYKLHTKLAEFVQLPPVSMSGLVDRDYGRQVAYALSRQKWDIIHIQHCSQYVPVIRKYNPDSRIVLHLHAEWFSQCRSRALLRRLSEVDLLTTVSNYVSEKVHDVVPEFERPIFTHYNGFDPEEFSSAREHLPKSPTSERVIMFAGGISPHKGLHVLLDAFTLLAPQFPDVRLNLIGPNGSYPFEETFDLQDRSTLKELSPFYTKGRLLRARKLLFGSSVEVPNYTSQLKARIPASVAHRVSFLGKIPRTELIKHYYAADVFAFPSLFTEGFGLPPIEAMAAGAPVVATRSGALVETIQDGKTGLLVERNDAQSLARALAQLLDDPQMRERMGRAGRARALEHFSWKTVTQKMYDTYQDLAFSQSEVRKPVQVEL